MTAKKTRSYDYVNLPLDAEAAMRLSGLEYMKALNSGEVTAKPSMIVTMGISDALDLDYGKVAFEADPADFLLNPVGTLHGGFAATLLDTALGVCVHTTLEAGLGYTTAELKVNYTRAILPTTGRLRAEATIVHRGRQMATSEARVVGIEDGKLYAHGSTTCLIFPLKPKKG
ncbi:MAG: PaaI family thioesterase [Sulfitobacter sp.]